MELTTLNTWAVSARIMEPEEIDALWANDEVEGGERMRSSSEWPVYRETLNRIRDEGTAVFLEGEGDRCDSLIVFYDGANTEIYVIDGVFVQGDFPGWGPEWDVEVDHLHDQILAAKGKKRVTSTVVMTNDARLKVGDKLTFIQDID